MQTIFCETFYPSFIADLIIGTLSASFGILGAYIIYLISLSRVRKDRLKYVVSLIESLVPSIKRQSDYCNAHAEEIVLNPFENIYLKLEANRDTKRLADKVDQEGVYHAYLAKYKRNNKTYQEFQTLYAHIDFLDSLVDDLLRTNEKILNFTWERKKHYAISFKRVEESIQSISVNQEFLKSHLEFIHYSNGLFEEFSAIPPSGENLVSSYNIVVKPLKSFITDKVQQHSKITELLFILFELTNAYEGIELSAKHNAIDYKDYSKQFKEKAFELDHLSKQLKLDFSTR